MNGKVFADTNILVYAYTSSEEDRREKVLNTLDDCHLVISTQVIKEFISVMVGKFKQPISDMRLRVNDIADIADIVDENLELIQDAIEIHKRYEYQFYDSLIIAAALKANCKILLSEDMHNGHVIDGLTIFNPFE